MRRHKNEAWGSLFSKNLQIEQLAEHAYWFSRLRLVQKIDLSIILSLTALREKTLPEENAKPEPDLKDTCCFLKTKGKEMLI